MTELTPLIDSIQTLVTPLGNFTNGLLSATVPAATPMSPASIAALDQLNDISLPEPIGIWPLAFAWWILLLSFTSILIGITWYFIDYRRRNTYRKQASAHLATIMQQDISANDKILEINRLLKQVALTAYGRQRVAALQSQEWIAFLQQNANYIKQPAQLQQILHNSYGKTDSNQLQIWHDYAQKWIKGHHQ